MGVRLLRAARLDSDPGPQPLRHACLAGRQIYALAEAWPELRRTDRHVGIYQAAGRETLQLSEAVTDLVEPYDSFDGFKPAAMIFEYLALGPYAQLAVALALQGPFKSVEGDELAGSLALATALDDLRWRRCDLALVGAYRRDPASTWLLLLEGHPEGTLRWCSQYTHGVRQPQPGHLAAAAAARGCPVRLLPARDPAEDPLGCAQVAIAVEAAQAGERCAVWSCSADGRGLLFGIGGG